MKVKGIISFPTLFTPKPVRDAQGNPTGDAKYSLQLLLPPNDPQLSAVQAEVNTASANTFPSGFPAKADKCLAPYDEKYKGKDYYDPRFSGWWVLGCTAKAEDKPAVVDANLQPLMDPGAVFSGAVVWVHLGISGYTKGTGGVGGWLNGVMLTNEEPPMGRLDNKPSVEQMFSGVDVATAQYQHHVSATGTPVPPIPAQNPSATPPSPPAPPVPPAPPAAAPAAPTLVMTAAANGVTYEAYKAANWTDEMLISNGLAIKPSFG